MIPYRYHLVDTYYSETQQNVIKIGRTNHRLYTLITATVNLLVPGKIQACMHYIPKLQEFVSGDLREKPTECRGHPMLLRIVTVTEEATEEANSILPPPNSDF